MTPRHFLIGTLAFTLAYNVAWALGPTGWVLTLLSVVAAAVCTLIVPAALHLWPQVHASGWFARALRAVVFGGIAAAATVTSFSHSVGILLAAGWTQWTAYAVTGGAELLVVLSTMALRYVPDEDVRDKPVRTDEQGVPPALPEPARDDVPPVPPAPIPDDEPVRLHAVPPVRTDLHRTRLGELVREYGPDDVLPSATAIRTRYGCNAAAAKLLRADLLVQLGVTEAAS